MSQWQPSGPPAGVRPPPAAPDAGAGAAGVSYITDNIAVVDHPRAGRNGQPGAAPAVGFILARHAHFRVYNLSPEAVYASSVWERRANKLCSFPVEARRPLVLSAVLAFCEDVRRWLEGGRDRLAVVHGGPGADGDPPSPSPPHAPPNPRRRPLSP